MIKFKSISVFFPAYNEEQTIENVTLKAKEFLEKISDDYEIIIINNSSRDKTGEIADRLSRIYKQVRVIHNPKNNGPGEALKTGFTSAKKEFVFYTDSDAQYDINEMERFLPYAETSGAVIGYRKNRADAAFRKITARVYAILNRILFGLTVKDIDCSFKLVSRSVLEKINFESRSAFINAELLLKIKKMGYPVKEICITHYPRQYGNSRCFGFSTIYSMLADMIRFKVKDEF